MKSLSFFLLLLAFSNISTADSSLSDQLNALDNAQNQAIANQRAKAEEDYNARIAEQKRMEQIAARQRETDRLLQEKAMQQRAEERKAEEAQAKIAQEKADAQAKAAEEERLRDKYRQESHEDEEREFIKRQSELKLQEAELELQKLKAKAELETAITKDRIKSVDVDTSIARKKETTEIDVTQSEADVARTVANGIASGISGVGNEGFHKFLVVFSLIILAVLVIAISLFFWARQKTLKGFAPGTAENEPVNTENSNKK